MLKFEMSWTRKELKRLKRKYTEITGGRESSPSSGDFRNRYNERLEFPDSSIMLYVVEKASSEPLSEVDLQRLILEARIFFRKEELSKLQNSLSFYEEKLVLDPQNQEYIWHVEYNKSQIPSVTKQLAKLQSEAKAAAEADDTAEADVSD